MILPLTGFTSITGSVIPIVASVIDNIDILASAKACPVVGCGQVGSQDRRVDPGARLRNGEHTAMKPGRPRLDHDPDFYRRFATLLPGLRAGTMSRGEASRHLGISHRSLNRYLSNAYSTENADGCGN